MKSLQKYSVKYTSKWQVYIAISTYYSEMPSWLIDKFKILFSQLVFSTRRMDKQIYATVLKDKLFA